MSVILEGLEHRLQDISKVPLCDLGLKLGRPEAKGIHVPADFQQADIDKYIHKAFQNNAAEYVKSHQNLPYHEQIVTYILKKSHFKYNSQDRFLCLDLCSGAGNSVIPLLNLYPKSEVIASDLSIELLCILKGELDSRALRERCALLQLNAEDLSFKDNTIDVIIACAALHHLIEPMKSLEGAARILKKNGLAIFVEPFESGYALLEMIWKGILDDPRAVNDVQQEVKTWFRFLITDWPARKGSHAKCGEKYDNMEDKWLFSRAFFEDAVESSGFTRCQILPLNVNSSPFVERTNAYLMAWPYGPCLTLPDWAWASVRRHEDNFSMDTRKEFLFECAVVLTK